MNHASPWSLVYGSTKCVHVQAMHEEELDNCETETQEFNGTGRTSVRVREEEFVDASRKNSGWNIRECRDSGIPSSRS